MKEREAYYRAVRDLDVARDVLQMSIGSFLATLQALDAQLEKEAPEYVGRFDDIVVLTRRHLADDIRGSDG